MQQQRTLNHKCSSSEMSLVLYDAAKYGQIEKVQSLLFVGVDPNKIPFNHIMPPLYAAAENGHIDVVRALLANGADVNVSAKLSIDSDESYKLGETALYTAVKNGHADIVHALLQAGASAVVNVFGGLAPQPIELAAKSGNLEIVNALLAVMQNNVNTGDYYQSALYAATLYGHCDVVRALLAGGATIESEFSNNTLLGIAAKNGYFDILCVFLKAGADANKDHGHPYSLRKPLLLAAQNGHVEAVEMLIKHGAVVNIKSQRHLRVDQYQTPLLAAAGKGHAKVLSVLLENGADVNAAIYGNRTPLCVAVENGNADVVLMLLEKGVDWSESEARTDQTPFFIAVKNNHLAIALLLLQYASAKEAPRPNFFPVAKGEIKDLMKSPRYYRIFLDSPRQEQSKEKFDRFIDLIMLKRDLKNRPQFEIEFHKISPLHVAIIYGFKDMIKLIEKNIDRSYVPDCDVTIEELKQIFMPEELDKVSTVSSTLQAALT